MVYFLQGDCREVLRHASSESVHCVVTSPPYWGLRDYGHAGQIGLESSPDAFIDTLVDVFREVRRVMRSDGTLWLNLGDVYTGSGKGGDAAMYGQPGASARTAAVTNVTRRLTRAQGIPPKNLLGLPWRIALALQADGWHLRSDIIWRKTNPMPESVRDRPTKAHEYLFLLTKSLRYYYDDVAIAEEAVSAKEAKWDNGAGSHTSGVSHAGQGSSTRKFGHNPALRNARSVWYADEDEFAQFLAWKAMQSVEPDVWEISTKPFRDAHFATFPPDLAERCIRAGTSEYGCCAVCGEPWRRKVKRTKMEVTPGPSREQRSEGGRLRTQTNGTMTAPPRTETIGWAQACECLSVSVEPCTVLDPFGGAFTTPMVADQLNRHGIGIELNPEYVEIGRKRIDARDLTGL